MTEDYWLPRRDGSRGTQIDTLQGGQQLGEVRDVEVFKEKLLGALNVPKSRFSDEGNVFGRGTEITRDELRFAKFITRLRNRFTILFDDLVGSDLVLKGVMSWAEWNKLKAYIHYDFLQDNYFSELFDADVMQTRLNLLRDIKEYEGIYFSKLWVQKNVVRFTERQIEDEDKQMEKERKENPQFDEDGNPLPPGGGDPNGVQGLPQFGG